MRLKSKKVTMIEDTKIMTDTESMRLYFLPEKTVCMFIMLLKI